MAEAHDVADGRGARALTALELLRVDLNPFTGDPRACDLYQIHDVIASTLRRAVALLDDATWAAGAAVLRDLSGRITTSLRREMGGPVAPTLVLELLCEATTPARKSTTQQLLSSVAEETRGGRYYSDVAGLHLALAKFALASQDLPAATRHWEDACVMMTAYTWRKDRTIYELLDPLEVLVPADNARARDRLTVLQPLCWRVVNHTDGKGTRHAPSQWWELLAATDPSGLVRLVVPELLQSTNLPSWRHEIARGTCGESKPNAATRSSLLLYGSLSRRPLSRRTPRASVGSSRQRRRRTRAERWCGSCSPELTNGERATVRQMIPNS